MKTILHVGMHKTATTTFQQWLYENRDALREKGIFYPDTSEFGVQQRYGHNRLAQLISMEPKEGARVVRKLRRRAAEQVSGDPTLLISAEALSSRVDTAREAVRGRDRARNAYVKRLANHFGPEARICIVLRRPDSFAESLHQQRVRKTRYAQTLAELAASDPLLDYSGQIALWQSAFDDVKVCLFEDLIADPLGAAPALAGELGLPQELPVAPTRMNDGLHPVLTEFKRLRNGQGEAANPQDVRRLEDNLRAFQSSQDLPWLKTKVTFWDPADRIAFLDGMAPQLEEIRARYFPDRAAPLFPEAKGLPVRR